MKITIETESSAGCREVTIRSCEDERDDADTIADALITHHIHFGGPAGNLDVLAARIIEAAEIYWEMHIRDPSSIYDGMRNASLELLKAIRKVDAGYNLRGEAHE